MELEEAIKIVKKDLESTKKANECGLSNNDFKKEIEATETVLNHITKQEKMIELMALALAETEFDKCCDYCHTDVCTAHDDADERAVCIKQYFEKKAEESE